MEATATEPMRPLRLVPTDYLGVDWVGDHFVMRARSLTSNPAHRTIGNASRYLVNGVEMHDHWAAPSHETSQFFNLRLMEAKWVKKTDTYRVAATDSNVVITLRSWPRERIVFVSDEARERFDQLHQDYEVGLDVAVHTARFKEHGQLPPLPSCWQERKDALLSPYQKAATALSLTVPGFALFMDMGTGKTACAVQRVCTLALMLERGEIEGGIQCEDGGRMLRVLVVVPKNVRLNWQREFQKFAHVDGKVTVLRGGLAKRVRKLAEISRPENGCKFSVLITSYDGVRTTADYISLIPWDDVVTDESHNYKDPKTDRFNAVIKLRDASARRMSLTGSPIGNSPMDLWSQLEFLRKGGSGFQNRVGFKEFHGVWERVDNGAQGVQRLVGLKNIPLLQERLARMSFSVTKEEAGLNLPDKVRSVIEVQMGTYQAEVYNRLQDELAIEIEDQLSGQVVDEMTVNNVLTQLLRLAQITSGFVTYDAKVDMDNGQVVVPRRTAELSPENPKVVALLDLLLSPERDPRAKTVVWCQFVHNIEIISAALTKAGIKHGCYYGAVSSDERDRLVDAFNCDPEFKVMVGNPQTAGVGLNLLGYDTRDPGASDGFCDLEVFFSIGWSAILRAQAEDRAHRRGTRMPVQVVDLVVPGSIDETILERISTKREMAVTVSDLRETLNRVLRVKTEQE